MARGKLTDKQWDALDELRFSTTDVAVFRNATIILMSGAGRSKQSIAEDLGCSPATVDNVRRGYREQGLKGLTPGAMGALYSLAAETADIGTDAFCPVTKDYDPWDNNFNGKIEKVTIKLK